MTQTIWRAIFVQYSNHNNVENRKCLGTAHANDFLAKKSSKVVCENYETSTASFQVNLERHLFLVAAAATAGSTKNIFS